MSFPLFDFSSAPPYQQIFDYGNRTDMNPVYIGWATPGVSATAAAWKIRKFLYNADGSTSQILYACVSGKASGDVGFIHIWNNRAALNYS